MKKTQLIIGLISAIVCTSASANSSLTNAKILSISCGNIKDESSHSGHDYFAYGEATIAADGKVITADILGNRMGYDEGNLRTDKACKTLHKLKNKTTESINLSQDEDLGTSLLKVKIDGQTLNFDSFDGFNG